MDDYQDMGGSALPAMQSTQEDQRRGYMAQLLSQQMAAKSDDGAGMQSTFGNSVGGNLGAGIQNGIKNYIAGQAKQKRQDALGNYLDMNQDKLNQPVNLPAVDQQPVFQQPVNNYDFGGGNAGMGD